MESQGNNVTATPTNPTTPLLMEPTTQMREILADQNVVRPPTTNANMKLRGIQPRQLPGCLIGGDYLVAPVPLVKGEEKQSHLTLKTLKPKVFDEDSL